jgi:hypothetical protein
MGSTAGNRMNGLAANDHAVYTRHRPKINAKLNKPLKY